MKKYTTAIIVQLVFLLGFAPWTYASSTGSPYGPEVKTYHGIPYLSGGVGLEERETLRATAKDDNLKLSFALKQGNYLGGAKVVIKTEEGKTVLEATSQGPWFFTKLPAGTYTVMATAEGKTLRQSAHVPARGQQQIHFAWKGEAHEVRAHSAENKMSGVSQSG